MKKIGIYVHFPFCVSKCNYCDFNSFANMDEYQQDYFNALIKEINQYSNKKILVDSIYIGGGTPSIMFDGAISTLMSELRKSFIIDSDVEVTIECNPNSVTIAKAREWKESGINRVSVGLQTASNNLLKLLGRKHTKNDYINAVQIIKSVGFANINTDCLVGLPRQKLSNVKHTLKLVKKMDCTHISVYSLILEKNTKLEELINNHKLSLPKEEKTIGMYNFALQYLKECGYDRYEISNFAKKGFECRHNLNTWKMGEYLGFGAGAHSYFNDFRYNNLSSIDKYIKAINSNISVIENKEKITNSEKFEETVMLGLRTKYGIDIDEIKQEFKIDLLKTKKDTISKLIANGFINLVYNKIIPTNSGYSVLNKIILELVS